MTFSGRAPTAPSCDVVNDPIQPKKPVWRDPTKRAAVLLSIPPPGDEELAQQRSDRDDLANLCSHRIFSLSVPPCHKSAWLSRAIRRSFVPYISCNCPSQSYREISFLPRVSSGPV